MDQISDPKWQSKHRNFNFIAGIQVHEKFQRYCEALDIRGHSRLASSLAHRVTPQLCEQYPQLLLVLRELALDPPNTDLPVFARPNEPSWQEIMQEDPLDGDHWQLQQFTDSSEDECPRAVTPPLVLVPTELSPPKSRLVVPDLPPALSTGQLCQEIKYTLLGYPSLLHHETHPELPLSIFDEVASLNLVVDAVRELRSHQFAGYAFEDFCNKLYREINGVTIKSVLAAILELKKLILPLAFVQELLLLDYIEMLDHLYTNEFFQCISRPFEAQVSLWTSTGQLGPLLSTYHPTTAELVDDEFELKLPRFMNSGAVIEAGKYARLATQIGVDCSYQSLVLDYTLEHQILVLESRNRHKLMSALVPLLLDEWNRVSKIYLVQDSRLVEFVLAIVDQRVSFAIENATRIASILKTCWFYPGFELHELIPQFQFKDPIVKLLLPLKQLEKQWVETVLAIIEHELYPSDMTREIALEYQAYNQAAVQSVSESIKSMHSVEPVAMP